jgi:signal transduction histidine kinase
MAPARIAAGLPVPVALTTAADGVVLDANEHFAALAGTSVAGALGRSLDELLGEPGLHAAIGADGEVEVAARRPDGAPMWLAAIPAPAGPGQLLTVYHDITARRRAEERLAEQAAALTLLAELPEKNPGPVCRIGTDGTILMANAAARTFLGMGGDIGDPCGQSWLRLCPGMTGALWQRVLAAEPGERIRHEAEREGVDVLFTHVRAETGDLVFAYGADITERRRDERLLAQKSAEVAEIARFPDMNPGPVLRMGLEGDVRLANAAARAVFGDQLLGRSWFALCPGLDDATWRRVLDTPGPVPIEARIAGNAYVFAHRHDPATNLVFVFGADVTAQKQAERALRQAEKMATLGTLAAGVAHELNNPAAATRRAAEQLRDAFAQLADAHAELQAAEVTPGAWALLGELRGRARPLAARPSELGALERADLEADLEDWLDEHGVPEPWELVAPLVAQGLGPEALSELAGALQGGSLAAALAWLAASFRVTALSHEISQGSARISEIVGALRSYSYVGQAPVKAVDLHEGLDNTLVILRNKLKGGIEVRRDYGAGMPPVEAYGGELNQVWTNLLDNAASALGGRGQITIRTRREGDWVVVSIEDDGPGIPEAVQSRVFDPFFTTKAQGEGTGLGLSTSYAIVTERHRGTITLASRPGLTRFTIRLPLTLPPEAP